MRKTMALCLVASLALAAAVTLGTTQAPAAGKATVKVGDNFFKPKSKKVRKGTTVRFKWTGDAAHNVTKRKGPGGRIESKTTSSRGVNFRKKFKQRGKYRFICTVHPSAMKLTLRVR